jgi:hypothetical protein
VITFLLFFLISFFSSSSLKLPFVDVSDSLLLRQFDLRVFQTLCDNPPNFSVLSDLIVRDSKLLSASSWLYQSLKNQHFSSFFSLTIGSVLFRQEHDLQACCRNDKIRWKCHELGFRR